jgi:hypothetical protein
VDDEGVVSMKAENFTGKESRNGVGWEVIPGLGRTGGSVAVDAPVDSREWAQGVLENTLTGTVELEMPEVGEHVLRVYMVDAGVVLDKIVVDLGGLRRSYLGPPETRR